MLYDFQFLTMELYSVHLKGFIFFKIRKQGFQSKYRTEVSTMYPLYQFDMDQRLSLNYLVHHISYPLYLYCCNFCIMRLLFVYLLLFHINYYMSGFNVVHVHVRSCSFKHNYLFIYTRSRDYRYKEKKEMLSSCMLLK